MEYIKCSAKNILGSLYDDKLFNVDSIIYISEISMDLDFHQCRKCNENLQDNLFVKLKEFQTITCSKCGILYVPVKKFDHYKGLRHADDPEWTMKMEDIF